MSGGESHAKPIDQYELLFGTDGLRKSLDLWATTGVSQDKVNLLRTARKGVLRSEDGRTLTTSLDENTKAVLAEYNAYVDGRKKTLKELETRNEFWDKGRNQTILTQDMPKTVLGGAK